VAGGEEGLWRQDGARSVPIETTDSWIESVGVAADTLYAATPVGLLRGPLAGPLQPVAAADDVASGASDGESFWGAAWPSAETVRRVSPDGVREERLPAPVLRVMAASGVLFADTEAGLFRRGAEGWRLARPRPEALPPGSAHLSALAFLGQRLVAGTFDGGIAVAEGAGPSGWRAVPGTSAWGVNALLAAGGELYVASLRGAARFDGQRLRAIEGPGAAFALAATDEGVAIGYAQGLLLPGATLVSAFHGLPGNQVLALASSQELFVGTPSGLGALHGRRVSWRVAAGESKLPNPWVTALLEEGGVLYVGTYGGGVARRVMRESSVPRSGLVDRAQYEPFPETEGLKINPGCLLRAGGRLYAGTDGAGLWRSSEDGERFERLALTLPSPRVTALLASDDALQVGTDEGLSSLPLRDLP
jgi:ligand-binding sensor domain-containing protein